MTSIHRMTVTMLKISVVGLCTLLVGCDSGETAKVGIVNIARVANELGRDRELLNHKAGEQQRLNALRTQLEDARKAELEKLGESPTEEQQAAAAQQSQKANETLMIAQNQAGQRLQMAQARMLHQVTQEVRSHVKTIAVKRGLTLVLKYGDYIVAAQPVHDITDEVVAQMATMSSLGYGDAPLPPVSTPEPLPPATTLPGEMPSIDDPTVEMPSVDDPTVEPPSADAPSDAPAVP